jgi:threonine dehydrogenase-like Zn-dependent dehydrogenase
MGHAPAGLFGYSHLTGHYPGGQAEYLRVPHADVSPVKIENDSLSDEQVLFLSDIFPTGYMAAENADIEEGDTVAVWGCGPVGQFAIQSAWMFGAGRVIAIDRVPDRLRMAEEKGKAEVINFEKSDHTVYERLQEMTNGRGVDRCIDLVGAEAHGWGSFDAVMDKAKASVFLTTDRAHVLREAIWCCRKGGTISMPGVYVGFLDKIPLGAFMNKGLTMKTGQTHVKRYSETLLGMIDKGDIDPSFVVTHRRPLKDGPEMYKTFCQRRRLHQSRPETVGTTNDCNIELLFRAPWFCHLAMLLGKHAGRRYRGHSRLNLVFPTAYDVSFALHHCFKTNLRDVSRVIFPACPNFRVQHIGAFEELCIGSTRH